MIMHLIFNNFLLNLGKLNCNIILIMNNRDKRESLVNRIKASDDYKSFAGILGIKKSNEEAAKLILESHAGRLTKKQLNFVYMGRSDQYLYFNSKAREFASEFSFEPAEMDWVLSTGIKKVIV